MTEIQYHTVFHNLLGKPQKSSSTNGQAIKRGGGGKAQAIKEKELFLRLKNSDGH